MNRSKIQLFDSGKPTTHHQPEAEAGLQYLCDWVPPEEDWLPPASSVPEGSRDERRTMALIDAHERKAPHPNGRLLLIPIRLKLPSTTES